VLSQTNHTPDLQQAALSQRSLPGVIVIENALTNAEIRKLRWSAFLRFRPSRVGSTSGRHSLESLHRTSSSALLPSRGSKAFSAIVSKIAEIANCTPQQIEPFQVARYRKGEEYRLHHDALPLNSVRTTKEQLRGGQRIATVLVYLNDLDSEDHGGRTIFPALDLAFVPRRALALLWWNTGAEGTLLPEMIHRAEAPECSTKYVLTCFIRERAIRSR